MIVIFPLKLEKNDRKKVFCKRWSGIWI